MISIFWDLETTDLGPSGQILQAAFVAVDDDWNEVSRLNLEIKLARTILPSPGAILVTGIDIEEHQRRATHTEREAMKAISDYINSFPTSSVLSAASGEIAMIGYNNMKFDLQYLRTSMIRNGLNPYFGNTVVNRDLLHTTRKLAYTNDVFYKLICNTTSKGGSPSLKLNDVAQNLRLSFGQQTHNALDDVLLTISVAKKLAEQFDIDVRTYMPYEAEPYEDSVVPLCYRIMSYTESGQPKIADNPCSIPMVFLKAEKHHTFWVDLNRYKTLLPERRQYAIKWFNKKTHSFIVDHSVVPDSSVLKEAAEAVSALAAHIPSNLESFFPIKNCDIEEHIYKLSFAAQSALYTAIWYGDLGEIRCMEGEQQALAVLLFERAILREGDITRPKVRDRFIDYAKYRYGGNMILSNGKPHATYAELLEEVNDKIASDNTEPYQRDLLVSLLSYYINSDIHNLCGNELLSNSNPTPANHYIVSNTID